MHDKLYYAGIGSRQTPLHIQTLMNQVARYLETEGWTLRSGAAHGADLSFEADVTDKEIYLPWRGYNGHYRGIHPRAYPFSEEEIAFSARFHPAWGRCSDVAKLMHTRNTRIIFGCKEIHGKKIQPVKFIICWTPGGAITGGTGQALRIAEEFKIPVINFGLATNPKELENLVLQIDEIQERCKAK